MLDLYFRDESEAVSRKVNAKNKKKSCGSRSKDSQIDGQETALVHVEIKPPQRGYQHLCARNPAQDITSQAIDFFLSSFVEASHFEYLRLVYNSASDQGPLTATTQSAALASLAMQLRDSQLMQLARKQYSDALALTNAALRRPKDAVQDSTLISVLLLGLFESLAFEGRQSPESWTVHTQGAATLIRLRGKSQFESEFGRRLMAQVSSYVHMSSAQRKVRPPLDFQELEHQALALMDPRDPIRRLSYLMDSFIDLRADLTEKQFTDEMTIIERALKIDKDAILLIDNLPPSYNFEVLSGDQAPSWSFRSTSHRYPNHHIALRWNAIRMIRLWMNEWTYKACGYKVGVMSSKGQDSSWNSTYRSLRELQHSTMEAAEQIVLDIVASTPQFTNLTTKFPPLTSRFLILPLAAAGESCLCPPDARGYIIKSLRILGNLPTIRQASQAADMLEESKPLEDWYVDRFGQSLE